MNKFKRNDINAKFKQNFSLYCKAVEDSIRECFPKANHVLSTLC